MVKHNYKNSVQAGCGLISLILMLNVFDAESVQVFAHF